MRPNFISISGSPGSNFSEKLRSCALTSDCGSPVLLVRISTASASARSGSLGANTCLSAATSGHPLISGLHS